MFDQIITVALNPSLDVTLWVDEVFPDGEPVSAKKEVIFPAGKSVNVARVLNAMGISCRVLGIAGELNFQKLISLLEKERVGYHFLATGGYTRENLSIALEDGSFYKINRTGFFLPEEKLGYLETLLWQELSGKTSPLMVFAGSLPQGITKQRYLELILSFRRQGVEIALDNQFFDRADFMRISPFLIKPNLYELSLISGKKLQKHQEIVSYLTQELSPFVSHMIVSCGSGGICYLNQEEAYSVKVPKVIVRSTIGAGDSTLAGFLTALQEGKSARDAIGFAASCGTAAVTIEGTGCICRQEAEKILKKVTIENISTT